MLDLKFVREIPDIVNQNIKNKLGSQYTDDLLYSNYLNPGGEFNFTNQFVWKKLY